MPDENGLIAANYRIDPSRPGPKLAGGLRAFMVTDRRDPSVHLLAVETRLDLPVRPRISVAHSRLAVPHAILPIEYGNGRDLSGTPGFYVISDGLPPNQLQIDRTPWRESDLVALVLQPAAIALAALQARGLTHRAINPDNLFRAGPRDPVTLGPFWAAPPASLQPALYEPPYMARCLPTGRGEGTIADDVYALGVTLLALLLGRTPLADLDEATILRRKIEIGSFPALTAGVVLPPLLADLLRSMLAEDPDHRPSPALLMKPEQARARRVAARPPRRAQQALNIGGVQAWSARELGLALASRPERGHAMLKNGDVERWLRRSLGDPQLGMRVEDITRRAAESGVDDARAQALLLMRGVAIVDPLSPLVWRGVAIQPDGLATALVGAPPEVQSALEEMVLADAVTQFHLVCLHREDHPGLREDQRDWRNWLTSRGPAGGLKRLTYGVNPMLSCASPLLGGRPVTRAADLLSALNEAPADLDRTRPPIDAHIAAFVVARTDTSLSSELAQLSSFAGPADRLAVLRLFGRLQRRLHPDPLPGLASWLVTSGVASVSGWKNHQTRAALQDQVTEAAQAGQIGTILDLLDDTAGHAMDSAGAKAAAGRVRQLEEALADIAGAKAERSRAAEMLGHEIVTGVGLLASLGATLALALP